MKVHHSIIGKSKNTKNMWAHEGPHLLEKNAKICGHMKVHSVRKLLLEI
jgi:phosphoribosyl-dephospho-CoA transferase